MGFLDFNGDGRVDPVEGSIGLGMIEDGDSGSGDELGDCGSGGCGCLTILAIAFVLFTIASVIASCNVH